MKRIILALACFFFCCSYISAQSINPTYCTYMVNPGFTYTVSNATVTFTDTTHWTGTDPTLGWYSVWNFGDGTTGNSHTITHTYPAPGTYTVQLIGHVTGGFIGQYYCNDTLYKQVTINVYPCSVNGLTISGSAHLRTVTFTRGVTENPQFTYTYLWNFGDGDTSTQLNPVHTYAADGVYTVN